MSTLLFEPTAPYWFLYALFFMFLVTPKAAHGRALAAGVALCALAAALASLLPEGTPYFIGCLVRYEVWFACGMLLAWCGADALYALPALPLAGFFLVLSVPAFLFASDVEVAKLALGALACAVVILLVCRSERRVSACTQARLGVHSAASPAPAERSAAHPVSAPWRFARYTMPIFLMHTIFAAGLRVALFKLGITGLLIHIPLGLAISFAGPVLAMLVMERLAPLDFLVYPNRYLRR